MSPVIAFDIAIVAQKSPVLRTGVLLKKWGCCWWWVNSRSGWLLELLTELKREKIHTHFFGTLIPQSIWKEKVGEPN